MDILLGDRVIECKDTTKADLEDIDKSPVKPILVTLLRQMAFANSFQVRDCVRSSKYDNAQYENGMTDCLEYIAGMLENGIEQSIEQK